MECTSDADRKNDVKQTTHFGKEMSSYDLLHVKNVKYSAQKLLNWSTIIYIFLRSILSFSLQYLALEL